MLLRKGTTVPTPNHGGGGLRSLQQLRLSTHKGRTDIEKDPSADRNPTGPKLRRLVRTLHRILRDSEGNSSLLERFDELTKLIYCKVMDERDSVLHPDSSAFQFRSDDTDESAATRVRKKFCKLVERRPDLFPERFSRIQLGDSATRRLAEELSRVSLADASEDLKGLIYEEIIRNTFDKGENQQFFTPRAIVEFMVQMLGPAMAGTICDPASGTGGFLLYVQKYLKLHGGRSGTTMLGLEIDERLAWVAGVNLDMYDSSCKFEISHLNSAGSLGDGIESLQGTVDTIVTNPPFGSDLSGREALNGFQLGKGKASRRRGVLFIERCLDLLKPGGAVGIIIDDGVLNGPSNIDTRRLILERSHPLAIISLPDTSFMPYASVKASILFLRKRSSCIKGLQEDPPTFFAQADTVGRKPNGDPMMRHDFDTGQMVLDSNLPEILEAWRNSNPSREEPAGWTNGRCFWIKVPTPGDKSFNRDGFRIDPAYHHPARNRADEALRASPHPLKFIGEICAMRNQGVIPSDDLVEEEMTYLGLANIEALTGRYSPNLVTGLSLKSSVKRFCAGDILFAKMRPELRKVCLINNELGEGFASAECLVLTPKMDPETGNPFILPDLLAILLRSDLVYGQVVHLVTGIGRPRLSREAVLNVQLPVPPRMEQHRLLERYHRSDEEARTLAAEAERALQEAEKIKSEAQYFLVGDILSPRKV